jgi:hypothetical protein
VFAKPGNAAATVSWQLPSDTMNVTGFEIVRQPGGALPAVPASARSFRDTGLTNGASYTYSVRTLSTHGSSPAVAAAAPVIPATVPARPRAVSAQVGRGSVTVTWRRAKPRGRAIVAYRLVWGAHTLKVGRHVRTATLTGLPKGRELRVAVRAKNAMGWGKPDHTRYVRTRR